MQEIFTSVSNFESEPIKVEQDSRGKKEVWVFIDEENNDGDNGYKIFKF